MSADTVPQMTQFVPLPIRGTILAPGQTTANLSIARRFEQLEVARYNNGEAMLCVHAMIRYKDIFGKSHWTSVCAFRSHSDQVNQFSYCEQGNEMDPDENLRE